MANGEPRSTPAEELSEGNEEKKRSKDTENTNDIVSIEDDEEDEQPKPKPKKKRDSGYTKSLQEAMANLKMTDNQKQRRVSLIQCTPVITIQNIKGCESFTREDPCGRKWVQAGVRKMF